MKREAAEECVSVGGRRGSDGVGGGLGEARHRAGPREKGRKKKDDVDLDMVVNLDVESVKIIIVVW